MKLTYGWESFGKIIPELPRLFKIHYDEVIDKRDLIKMDFKWDRHIDLEKAGILKCLTIRSEGLLVGYIFWFINENLNFLLTNAITSLYFLDPLYRAPEDGVYGGRQMFLESEEGLYDMGADIVLITSPSGVVNPAFDRMMKGMGYNPFQNVYSKMRDQIQAKGGK